MVQAASRFRVRWAQVRDSAWCRVCGSGRRRFATRLLEPSAGRPRRTDAGPHARARAGFGHPPASLAISAAARNVVRSWRYGPTICTPIGRPSSPRPAGTTVAGSIPAPAGPVQPNRSRYGRWTPSISTVRSHCGNEWSWGIAPVVAPGAGSRRSPRRTPASARGVGAVVRCGRATRGVASRSSASPDPRPLRPPSQRAGRARRATCHPPARPSTGHGRRGRPSRV